MIRKLEKARKDEAWTPFRRSIQTKAEREEEIRRQAIKDARQAVKGIRHLLEESVQSTPRQTDGRVGKRRG